MTSRLWRMVESIPFYSLDARFPRSHECLDQLVSWLRAELPSMFLDGFFSNGWGNSHIPSQFLEDLKNLKKLHSHGILESSIPKIKIELDAPKMMTKNTMAQKGAFISPCAEILPIESQTVLFEAIIPTSWQSVSLGDSAIEGRPFVIILPGLVSMDSLEEEKLSVYH